MENLISIRMTKEGNFFLNLSAGNISRLENLKNCNMKRIKFLSLMYAFGGLTNLIASFWLGIDYAILGALLFVLAKLEE